MTIVRLFLSTYLPLGFGRQAKNHLMVNAIAFDTLAYAKKLIEAGFTQEQAEVQAEALAEIIDERLATKQDLRELEMRLIIRLGAMMAASMAIVRALGKLL